MLVVLAAGLLLSGVVAFFVSPWWIISMGVFLGALAGLIAYFEFRGVHRDG